MTLQEIIIELHNIAREQKDIRIDARLRAIADSLAEYDNMVREKAKKNEKDR